MREGQIRVKTLNKILALCYLTGEKGEPLILQEIVNEIHCSKGHAYNYLRTLEKLRPLLH